MNAPLRRVAIAVFVLFGLLFVNLNYVQFVRDDELRGDSRNNRVLLQAYERQRGDVVVDGQAVAQSQATDGRLKYLRTYPARGLYAHVVGYESLVFGDAGIESAREKVLSGDDDRLFVRRVSDTITGRSPRGGNVVLTLGRRTQQAAYEALGSRKGAIVALDPRTGAVLASVTGPTFDPNPLASHDREVVRQQWERLQADPAKPLLNRALTETYPPGSTFKVVVSAAALANGSTPDTQVPSPRSFTPPQTTNPITNFGESSCGGATISLQQALTISCNTSYAKLGLDLGEATVRRQAEAFGFEQDGLEIPLPTAPSRLGPMADPPSLAQSSIGQRDVRMTPLQGALIAGAVARNGSMMRPFLIKELQGPDFSTLDRTEPAELRQSVSPEVAAGLQQMMVSVVEDGTGRNARIDGATVGGKTGTAQNGEGNKDHSWFIGYVVKDNEPVAAVAVVLENNGTSKEAAGLAGDVLEAAIRDQGAR